MGECLKLEDTRCVLGRSEDLGVNLVELEKANVFLLCLFHYRKRTQGCGVTVGL